MLTRIDDSRQATLIPGEFVTEKWKRVTKGGHFVGTIFVTENDEWCLKGHVIKDGCGFNVQFREDGTCDEGSDLDLIAESERGPK